MSGRRNGGDFEVSCEIDINEVLGTSGLTPRRILCRPLAGMGVPTPLCPFKGDQKLDCPLAKAEEGEIPLKEALNKFYNMIPA